MRLLVTGCAGFIGSRVCELLLEQGHTLQGIDNLNDAYDVRLKEWRINRLRVHPRFDFHRLDITDRTALGPLFEGPSGGARPGLDAVVNLAARAGVQQSLEDPWVFYQTNVTGTLNLLELSRETGVQKFILASSSSVYGDGKLPFSEDQPTDRPLSAYAASKKAAETLCYTYHHLYGLDITVLRYFTVYGPAGRPDMSIFRFIKWISEGEPLLLYGDGSQERDFTYVGDIARGTVLALKPLGFEIINLGSDRPMAIRDVISTLEGLLEKKADIQRRPFHAADMRATRADISRAQDILGWEPHTGVEEGLKRAVEWYRQNRHWAMDVSLG